jgi:uncharacterized protein YaiE (UPF0345 family)
MAQKKDSAEGEIRGETPDDWNGPEDARKGAGQYPNYWVRKTRSGHTFIFDDTQDKEHITLQHRSGAMLQMMPDGAIQIVAHRGQYNLVFGESRVKITGAQDITVDGDASFKVKGNQNMTVDGDSTLAIKGKYTVTAKSMNTTVAENMDTVAGSKTEKIDGSSTTQVAGAASIVSKGGMTLGSTGDDVGIGSGKNLGLAAKGTLSTKSDGQTSMKATGDIAVDGARILQNSGASKDAVQEVAPSQPDPNAAEPPFDHNTPVS